MQTRRGLFSKRRKSRTSLSILLIAACTMMFASGCTLRPPHIDGQAEGEQHISTCEQALQAAQHASRLLHTTAPASMRYLASKLAPQDWLHVAVTCPNRFDEGVLRSAQTLHIQQTLAAQLGEPLEAFPSGRLDDVERLAIDPQSLAQLAHAEDRAGFAQEVLAARAAVRGKATPAPNTANTAHAANATDMKTGMKVDGKVGGQVDEQAGAKTNTKTNAHTDAQDKAQAAAAPLANYDDARALLAISDTHKTAGNQLMALSTAPDERGKVYSVDALLASDANGWSVDASVGLRAPSAAIVEMNCARDEITRIAHSQAAQDTSKTRRIRTLKTLAALTLAHIDAALAWGYPAFDAALLHEMPRA